MAIKKVEGGWLVDSQPGGRGGKRFRKTFTTQAEAKQYDAWLKTQVAQSPDWAPERRDSRKLSELVDLWHQHHGVKVRAVPISEELRKELLAHHDSKETGNRLFANAYSAFREAIERAKIELPEGQLTHVLRHTFASHFMMRGGNILTLNKILGHASLAMTMRYAHLAPEHLQEAILFNPLAPAAKPKKRGTSSAQKKESKPR
jgi:hypothetical protein